MTSTKEVLQQSLKTIHRELATQLAFFRHGGDFNEAVILRVTNEMFLLVVASALEEILLVEPDIYKVPVHFYNKRTQILESLRQEGGDWV